MKKLTEKKYAVRILAALIAVLIAVPLLTAVASAKQVTAGKTVTVSFTLKDIYSVDGNFEFSDRDLFTSVKYKWVTEMFGTVADDRVYLYGSGSKLPVTIQITLTAASDAKAGDACDIVFHYRVSDDSVGMGNTTDWKTSKQTVTIKEGSSGTDDPAPDLDTAELKSLVAEAGALEESAYTAESWKALEKQLKNGQTALKSKKQSDVDSAAKALKKALEELVKLNIGRLETLISSAKALNVSAHGPLWFALSDRLKEADEALASRDQAKIDAAADALEKAIQAIEGDEPDEPKEVIREVEVIKEVTVEVPTPPEGDYCNVGSHSLWMILFFVAAGLVLLFVIAAIILLARKKANQRDNTPLVDYDINDDM
ncbi:MAG: hypothetical protein ILO68_06275 [Clostridia bacterium]|nr:hypothetical protein [Clostridia bacterium]